MKHFLFLLLIFLFPLLLYGQNNVGINTLTPDRPLTIMGLTGQGLKIQRQGGLAILEAWANGDQVFLGTTTNHPMHFITNGSSNIFISNNGRIGLGLTSGLTERLHVNGGIVLGNTVTNTLGAIKFTQDSLFMGYNGLNWIPFGGTSPWQNDTNGSDGIRYDKNVLVSTDSSNVNAFNKFEIISKTQTNGLKVQMQNNTGNGMVTGIVSELNTLSTNGKTGYRTSISHQNTGLNREVFGIDNTIFDQSSSDYITGLRNILFSTSNTRTSGFPIIGFQNSLVSGGGPSTVYGIRNELNINNLKQGNNYGYYFLSNVGNLNGGNLYGNYVEFQDELDLPSAAHAYGYYASVLPGAQSFAGYFDGRLAATNGIELGAPAPGFNQPGALRYFNNDFEGYNGTVWKSLTSGGSAIWNDTDPDGIFYNSGNVGIGTMPNNTEKFTVKGLSNIERIKSKGIEIKQDTILIGNPPFQLTAYTGKILLKSGISATDMIQLDAGTSSVKLYNGIDVDPKIQLIANYMGSTHSRIITDELEIKGGSDFAEHFDILEEEMKPIPGMIVSIDPNSTGKLEITKTAYDKKVAGIISGANGVKTGLMMGQDGSIADGDFPIALTGRVYVYANREGGEIKPGDLLTTSSTPGQAMKVLDYTNAQGAIIGKAMTTIDKNGFVLVLVNLQ